MDSLSLSTPKRVLTFVSGNKEKILEVTNFLTSKAHVDDPDFPFKIVTHKIDLDEIQGEIGEISARKAKDAAKIVNGAVIVDDTGLVFDALNGLPGAYIKWFLKKLGGNKGLVKLLAPYEDKTAHAQCAISYCAGPDSEPKVFLGSVPGSIVEPRGSRGFGWDPVFQPEGFEKTFDEMKVPEKAKISHRGMALSKFKDWVLHSGEV